MVLPNDLRCNRNTPPAVPEWVADSLLDDEQQAALGEYLTPRIGLDGEWVWPLGELGPSAWEGGGDDA
jgi:hypothetical protein